MKSFDPYEVVNAALADIAPDVDPDETGADLHDDLGLDSMDMLNLAAAISERAGIEIPECDYPALRTIAQLAAYLGEHAPSCR